LQKLADSSACVPFFEKVRNTNGVPVTSGICENGLDNIDGAEFDDIDGRMKIRCCVTINSDNDEPDGLGDNGKNVEKVMKSAKKDKGAKKLKTPVRTKGYFGRRHVYVVTGSDPEQTEEMSDEVKLPSAFSGEASADRESLRTKSNSVCSDGLHCGVDSDSDERSKDTERDSVKLGRYAVRYTKDPQKSGQKISPLKKDPGSDVTQKSVCSIKGSVHSSQSSIHSSKSLVQSSESSLYSSETPVHSSIQSKQTDVSLSHSTQSSVHSSEISSLSSDEPVQCSAHSTKGLASSQLESVYAASSTASPRKSNESKKSRSSREVKVKPAEGSRSRSHRDATKVALGEALSKKGGKDRGKKITEGVLEEDVEGMGLAVKADITGGDRLDISLNRDRSSFKLPKRVASGMSSAEGKKQKPGDLSVDRKSGDHSEDSRPRRRRRRVKKDAEVWEFVSKEEKKEETSTLSSTCTSDTLDGSNSKAIVRGVFNRLRQSRGVSDESSTFSSTSSRESTLTQKDVNFDLKEEGALSGHSLKVGEPLKKSKALLSKSLRPSFKPYSYFEKPLGQGGARPKAGENLPVLKRSKEFEEKLPVATSADKAQMPKDNMSKSYAFGDYENEGMFRSWVFRQRDSSTSSTTSDTTPSSARVSQESLHSVKSIESEEDQQNLDEDMEETIQSPQMERKVFDSRTDTAAKVGNCPFGDSNVSSTQGDRMSSMSRGPGDSTSATSSSMEMSELYNIYAKQLDTLDIVDSSSENESGVSSKFDTRTGAFGAKKKRRKKARLRTLTETVEKGANLERPDTDDSVGSAGSVEKSMFNLENLPVIPRENTSRKEESDSEGDLEELCDVYLDQLQHMKR
jgi:hypothetical protein